MTTTTMNNTSEIAKVWNKLNEDNKLGIIEGAIELGNVSDGFLMLKLYRKTNDIQGFMQDELDDHLCVEAVSYDTLATLFDENHEFNESDAQVILNWINSQK
jgi:hypothetical protein